MNPFGRVHGDWIHKRRVSVLASRFAAVIPPGARRMLDVGCGDGRLACALQALRPDLSIHGLDVFVRPDAAIPVTVFDGSRLPYGKAEFDAVMFADVLHHTTDPLVLLREGARVARLGLAIKDHLRQGMLAQATLSFMDWVGNASHGVALPCNYWRPEQWRDAFQQIGLKPAVWETRLNLYPKPADLLFERSLHFLAWLESER